MRVVVLALVLLSLAGCDSVLRPGSDAFAISGATPQQFELDSDACRLKANDRLSYDARGGTRYARNRAFNAVFDGCMKARGYRPRPYIRNLLPG